MKKIMIALAVAMMVATVAMAGPVGQTGQVQVGYSGSGYGKYQTGEGGEFTLTPLGTPSWLDTSAYDTRAKGVGGGSSFQTFCIEHNEVIYPYSQTYNATVNTGAINGGVGGQIPGTSFDPVSQGTGWLYSMFASGNWDAQYAKYYGSGYNYDGDRSTSAAMLQQAIWYLEDEITLSAADIAANIYIQAALDKFNGDAKGGSASDFGVYALNLSGNGQDQLYFAGTPVPDGGTTVLLLGLGLAGLAAISRRFQA
jgi:hypothetical protein